MSDLNYSKNDPAIAPVGLLAQNDELSSTDESLNKSESPQVGAQNTQNISQQTNGSSQTSQTSEKSEVLPNPLISNDEQNLELTNVSEDTDSSFPELGTRLLVLTVITVSQL